MLGILNCLLNEIGTKFLSLSTECSKTDVPIQATPSYACLRYTAALYLFNCFCLKSAVLCLMTFTGRHNYTAIKLCVLDTVIQAKKLYVHDCVARFE